MLIPIDLSTGVDGKDHDQDDSEDSDYVPSLDDESDFDLEDCPSLVYDDSSSEKEDEGSDD